MKKIYYTYNAIHKTVAKVAEQIIASDFEPDLIVAIGSGGFIPALILRTFIDKPILAVALSYYDEHNQPKSNVTKLQWVDEADDKIRDKRVLLVDEIDDTRVTLAYCVQELFTHHPREIAVCALHSKIKLKQGEFPPRIKHLFIGENVEDAWIVYPWAVEDIDTHDAHALNAHA